MTRENPPKARFSWTDGSGNVQKVSATLNPHEFTLERGAQLAEIAIPGLDSPIQQFVRGQTESLQLELFFDTTDERQGDRPVPVTRDTDRVYELVKIDPQTHAPPICRFEWGEAFPGSFLGAGGGDGEQADGGGGSGGQSNQRREGFRCMVERVQQRFTLFSPEGIPLRAVLNLTVKEYKTVADQVRQLNLQSADHTRAHVVRAGDTLSSIAAARYRDASRWRAIATHNQIEDPLALRPGMVLELPPLS